MRHQSEEAPLHVVDAVVATQKRVSEDKEVLFVAGDGQGADLRVAGDDDYVVFWVGLEPMAVHHELQGGEFVSVFALEE